jgi:phage terminase large subunit-like protein
MSTVIYNERGEPLLYVPNWFQGQATKLLKYVNAVTTSNAEVRRKICSREPLIFALVYLRGHLSSEETSGKRSLNPLHIWLAEHAAAHWPFPLKPKECRVGLVAPRDSGKTTWEFLILPLWGGAYGWRVFQLFLSSSGDNAREHLGNLKWELANNDLLRADFPELCEPERKNGRTTGDNSEVFRSASGVTFMAKGIDAKNLGRKEGRVRPDLIVVDDVEPIGKYSKNSKEERLRILVNGVLPMNLNAAVYLVGTVVRYGSIMHEVVKAETGGGVAEWIAQENFTAKYWPIYFINSRTGKEESFWPEKWSLSWIKTQLRIDSFQLNYMNQPVAGGVGMFSKNDLKYGAPFRIASKVLAIDPATTSKETSDYTGLAVIGFDAAKLNAFVEYAKGVRLDPDRMRELVRVILLRFPEIDTVVIETIQGGDYVLRTIRSVIPQNIRVVVGNDYAPKPERIRDLHDWCQRGWVYIGTEVHAFVDQALSYPDVDYDDVIDAVAKGCHHYLQHRELPRAG